MRWLVHAFAPAALESALPEATYKDYHAVVDKATGQNLLTEWGPQACAYLEQHLRKIPEVCQGEVHWHHVTLDNYHHILLELTARRPARNPTEQIVVLNLVDGADTDGWPGASVVQAVEASGLPFTGANAAFYQLDAKKADMKRALVTHAAEFTPRYVDLTKGHTGKEAAIRQLAMPVLVKPNISSGSSGITEKSVVFDAEDAVRQATSLAETYGGAYVEEFITGQEFTCFVMGDSSTGIRTYAAAQRAFRADVPTYEQFLSFSMKWNQWGAKPNEGKWWYDVAPAEFQQPVQEVAAEVYRRIGGNGYVRMDIRRSASTGRLYVVDVNANCSLDSDEDSSLSYIRRGEGVDYSTLLAEILQYALRRAKGPAPRDI